MSYAKVNFRRIPDLNFNGNKKLKKKKKATCGNNEPCDERSILKQDRKLRPNK